MNPANTVERSVGRIEGQLEGVVATLKRVDDRSAARDGQFEEMSDRMAALEIHAKSMVLVTNEFNALQQAIRDGKMAGRGIVLGVAMAAGAGGATVATFFKGLWAWLGGS
jgi:hypothetical protein